MRCLGASDFLGGRAGKEDCLFYVLWLASDGEARKGPQRTEGLSMCWIARKAGGVLGDRPDFAFWGCILECGF
jgi:hypothetical protein